MGNEAMQVSVTTTNGLERRLEVAVPGERLAGEVDQRLKRLTRTARLKGFRPGKVPYAVVRAQFGSQVHAEAVNDLMQRSFAEAVTQEKLKPAGGPRIEPLAVAPGSAELRYAAVFEVMPEVSVKPVDSLRIERPTVDITAADVEAMLESLRAQRPVFTRLERAAQAGDRVTLDYEGRIDGSVFPGGKGQGMTVIIGQHRILAEIETALVGMSPGDTKTIAAKFPDDYGAKSVAGKTAEFDLKVTQIEAQSLPPLDAEFAKGFGVTEGGAEGLRAEVESSMKREVTETVRARVREQIFDALHRDNPLEVPRTLVGEQIRELQAQMMRRLGTQDPAQVQTPEALASFEQPARKRVALGLLIGEIVRAQQLKLDRARVEERLDAATAQHEDPQAARRQYLASREAMEQIESAALEDQALDWALSQVKVVDQPSTFQALTGFGQNH
jgi:trigger factor